MRMKSMSCMVARKMLKQPICQKKERQLADRVRRRGSETNDEGPNPEPRVLRRTVGGTSKVEHGLGAESFDLDVQDDEESRSSERAELEPNDVQDELDRVLQGSVKAKG